jgi:GPI mannosyltransferase 3
VNRSLLFIWRCAQKHSALIILLAVAFGIRIGLAIYFPSILHPDEIFQTLEPAHRLAYGYSVTTWEWRLGVRSWVFPSFLAGVMRATAWMGSGASGYTRGVIVVLSALSLSSVWFAYAWAKRISGISAALIAAGASAFFFELVYFAPKALNEVVATHVLLPGLYLGIYGCRANEKKRLILAGALCGLAASLRIQFIPAIAIAAIYFCYPSWRQRILPVTAGLVIPIAIFGFVDKLTWSYPWQSFVRYYQVNVTEGRSLEYGVEPWYWYFPVIVLLLGPIICFIWQGSRRSPFLAAIALIILGSHSLLSHKEIRFIYPVLPLAITLAAIGLVESFAYIKARLNLQLSPNIIVAIGLLFFAISSALVASRLYVWCETPSAEIYFDQLSQDPTLCGIALYNVNLFSTGGYYHLHRNIPIIPVTGETDLSRDEPEFNILIAPAATIGIPNVFRKDKCRNRYCLYRREGICTPPKPDSTINAVLRKVGK